MADVQTPLSAATVAFLGQFDGRLTVEGSIEVDAPAHVVYQLLTDYQRAPEVFRNVVSSTSEVKGTQLVVKQECTWQFLVFSGTFELALAVDEQPTGPSLKFRLQESKFMRDFEGRWLLTPKGPDACRVVHTLSVTPAVSPPDAVASYTADIFVRQVQAVLDDVQQGLYADSS